MTKFKTTARRIAITSTLLFACLGTTAQANELSKQINQDVVNALSNVFSNQVTLFMTEINRDIEIQVNKTLIEFGSIMLPTEKENVQHSSNSVSKNDASIASK